MNEIEKAIWVSVYSVHMANFQKRHEFKAVSDAQADYYCQESIDWAYDAILSLRRNAHHLREVEDVLNKTDTPKRSVGLDRLDEVILRGT